MRHILYSPGFGAGWSTWMCNIPKQFACEYQPIIQAIQNGEDLMGDNEKDISGGNIKISLCHPAVQQFVKECQEKYNETPYLGGLEDLVVCQVEDDEKVRIEEHDGSERVITCYSDFF